MSIAAAPAAAHRLANVRKVLRDALVRRPTDIDSAADGSSVSRSPAVVQCSCERRVHTYV
jgi:hypothetical protein